MNLSVSCPRCSHAFTVPLPDAPVVPLGPRGSHRGTPVTFAARPLPQGTLVFGATARTFAASEDGALERWVELAYAVSMVETDVTLSREDFERVVANFARYPCVPVVIEHADTDWFPRNPAWAEPHGHVEELRIGEREVEEADGSKRLAATLEGRVRFDEATAPLVGPQKKWRFGSVTLFKGVTDEATGAGLGALLWSWSLTAHPRLTALAPIPASLDPAQLRDLTTPQRAALLAALNATNATTTAPPAPVTASTRAAPPTPTPEDYRPMKTFLEIAHELGLAAHSEEDARAKVLAFAAQHGQALKLLGLAPAAPPAELAAKVGDLQAAAGRLPALEQKLAAQDAELAAFRQEKAARDQADLDQHLADLFAVHPELRAAEEALRCHAAHDRAAFAKKHPRPSAEELAQAAQHPARLAPIVPPAARPAAPGALAFGAQPLAAQGSGAPPSNGAPVNNGVVTPVDAGALVASLHATAQAATGQPLPLSALLRG